MNLFLPNKYVKSVFEIRPEELKEIGIKGIITDLDNTLVPWNVESATNEVRDWFQLMSKHGIKVVIISNNNEERVKLFAKPLDIPFLSKARKPLPRTFNRARKLMGLNRSHVAVVGDQLLTDILGGNFAGYYTVLVRPIVETDAPATQFNRKVERIILSRLRRRGKLYWEE